MKAEESPQQSERRELISKCVTELCNGLGLRVEDSRIVFYAKALDNLTPVQLRHGFDIANRNLGAFLPDVKQLRDWCESWRPPGYEQPKPLEKSDLTKAAVRLKVTKEDIAEWLEAGKTAQLAHIAALEADPEWCALRDSLVRKDFKPRATRVPTDPEERKAWATAEAAPWRRG